MLPMKKQKNYSGWAPYFPIVDHPKVCPSTHLLIVSIHIL
jgi:hypothetical protein